MNILIVGGAGYVGSVTAELLTACGHRVTVFDNLEQGHAEAVPQGAEFILGDLKAPDEIRRALERCRADAVVHLAGETVVGASMTDPSRYFRKNVVYGLNLLDVMREVGVSRIVFSSTSAIYGEPRFLPITEDHPISPMSAYGESKALFERILSWYNQAYGFKVGCLRYFNACGASQLLGEHHHPESHLIPIVLRTALGLQGSVQIFGTDYNTRDGTCVRDLTHVCDIGAAHLAVLENIDQLNHRCYNLGNGSGYSVLEVVDAARRVTGCAIPVEAAARRPGDPVSLVASAELIKSELGWTPRFPDLGSIIESAWTWMLAHPHGYHK
jgi:UDP-glucose 4-epimerase